MAYARPNKTAFMSGNCVVWGFACGVHRVPVRRARPRSIDVEFDQPKPAQPHHGSVPRTGGAVERDRAPQRPAGARPGRAFLYLTPKRGHILAVDELSELTYAARDRPLGETLELTSAPPGHQTHGSAWWRDAALERKSTSGASATGPVSCVGKMSTYEVPF